MHATDDQHQPEPALDDGEILRLLGFTNRATLWRMRQRGDLPMPDYQIGKRNLTLQSKAAAAIERIRAANPYPTAEAG